MVTLHITDRAALEIEQVQEYTKQQWGQDQADKYIADIDRILQLLQEYPDLLQTKTQISQYLKFYATGKHILVFEKINDEIYLITVKHTAMDLDSRMPELEPVLKEEVRALRARLLKL